MHTADHDTHDSETPDLRSAHVIVVANEKGGSGKSTLSIHLSVALLKAGFRVATIDLDVRQRTLTRFFENRLAFGQSTLSEVEIPRHFAPSRGETADVHENEAQEFVQMAEALGAVEHDYEFVVIDTPASDSHLMRLAHSLADTLVTPMNDSFIDMDGLTRVNPDRSQRGGVSHYAALVLDARRQRRLVDQGIIDWVLVRNRVASLQTNNARQIQLALGRLAGELQCRIADGLHDRVIFRELFPLGLTAMDALETAAHTLTPSQMAARDEVTGLIATLRLPTRLESGEHLAARHLWFDATANYYRDSPPGFDSAHNPAA